MELYSLGSSIVKRANTIDLSTGAICQGSNGSNPRMESLSILATSYTINKTFSVKNVSTVCFEYQRRMAHLFVQSVARSTHTYAFSQSDQLKQYMELQTYIIIQRGLLITNIYLPVLPTKVNALCFSRDRDVDVSKQVQVSNGNILLYVRNTRARDHPFDLNFNICAWLESSIIENGQHGLQPSVRVDVSI